MQGSKILEIYGRTNTEILEIWYSELENSRTRELEF